MQSRATLAGHPLHPMLVSVPIGLFLWAFVSDLVYLGTDHNHEWYTMAFWTGIAALVSAAVAALPGIVDFTTVGAKSDARAMGIAHGLLNVTTLALFFVAMLLMLDDGATSGGRLGAVVAMHAAGSGLLLLSGWLGGEMVFRHHLGMIPEDSQVEREERVRHHAGAVRPMER